MQSASASAQQTIYEQDFDNVEAGTLHMGWTALMGFDAKAAPVAEVREGVGIDGSKALAVRANAPFRADWIVSIPLRGQIDSGVVWFHARYKPSRKERSALFFTPGDDKNMVGVIGMEQTGSADKQTDEPILRAHASWTRAYWRLYRTLQRPPAAWHQLTMRIDFNRGSTPSRHGSPRHRCRRCSEFGAKS